MPRTKRKERDLLSGADSDASLSEQEHTQQRRTAAVSKLADIVSDVKRLKPAPDTAEVDAAEIDKELIARRLRKAVVESRGLVAFESVAERFGKGRPELVQALRSEHRKGSITRLVFSPVSKALFSSDKKGSVVKWNMDAATGPFRKQHVFKFTGLVRALAISSDGRYLAVGLESGSIHIVDALQNKHLGTLGPNSHRAAVTDLSFQAASYQLYSSSHDRTVKIWNVEQLVYIDTVFGHQDAVLGVAAPSPLSTRDADYASDRCVTVGGRDRTVRLWKVVEESQLIFRLSEQDGGSLDEIVCTGRLFVTASDTGTLSVWSSGRKKPIGSAPGAHGSSVLTLYSPEATDLVVSAGSDGAVRFWRIPGAEQGDAGGIELVNELAVPGHVTGVVITGDTVVVAVGPEGRSGRWTVDSDIKPSILVFKWTQHS